MSSLSSGTGQRPVALIEEATQLLRRLPVAVHSVYAVGTLPFVLGLLFFWSDMSRSALAPQHCSASALALALLFIWMKSWQTVYCRLISARLARREVPPWRFAYLMPMIARQGLLQATGLILLPLAVLFTVPAAWVYAFYQNATVLDDGDSAGLTTLVRTACHQAALWPRQNHLVLLIMGAFGFFVFLNAVMLLALAPMLLKRFLGLDTVYTLSGVWGLFNTTFLAVALALVHVCLDPLIKTLYTLRCFYGQSLETGEDLRARLARRRRAAAAMPAAILACLAWGAAPGTARAEMEDRPPAAVTAPPTDVRPAELDTAIRRVLAQPRYTWRLSRDEAVVVEDRDDGWLSSFFRWLGQTFEAIGETIGRWLERIGEWLWEDATRSRPESVERASPWPDMLKSALVLAGAVLVAFLVVALRRHYQRKAAAARPPAPAPSVAVADLSDDRLRADELPTDEWLRLAQELAAEGRYRLAMRACFFSTLSRLAAHQVLRIADYKSNHEYAIEVVRRSSDRPSLGEAFRSSVARLDLAWYGMRTVSPRDFTRFAEQQKEIAHLAQG